MQLSVSISILFAEDLLQIHSMHLVYNEDFLVIALVIMHLLVFSLIILLNHWRAQNKRKYVNLLERFLVDTEKKNLAIQKSEKKCQLLIDHLTEGFLLVNDKGVVLLSNARSSIFLGLPPEKIIHQPLPAWLLSGSKNPMTLSGNIRKGLNFSDQLQVMHGDKTRWIRVKWSYHPTEQGEPGAAIVLTDITDRVECEEKIQQLTIESNEKNKQINCLFDISDISGVPNITFEGIFERSLEIIPNGLKFTHDAWVEIVFEGRRFVSKNFRETPWNFIAPIKIRKKKLGHIRVGYLEEKPKTMRDAFHLNEKLLVKNIAEKLAQVIELVNMENKLRECTEKLQSSTTKKK
ncbi:MAG: PAS domain S-box protein [Bacteroidales bacterium]|nr:PAS domain S-box protein [Bacteroidales bacterium]